MNIALFSDAEISAMRKELDKYGIQMPAFSKIGGLLANEVTYMCIRACMYSCLKMLYQLNLTSQVKELKKKLSINFFLAIYVFLATDVIKLLNVLIIFSKIKFLGYEI